MKCIGHLSRREKVLETNQFTTSERLLFYVAYFSFRFRKIKNAFTLYFISQLTRDRKKCRINVTPGKKDIQEFNKNKTEWTKEILRQCISQVPEVKFLVINLRESSFLVHPFHLLMFSIAGRTTHIFSKLKVLRHLP